MATLKTFLNPIALILLSVVSLWHSYQILQLQNDMQIVAAVMEHLYKYVTQ